MTTDYKKEESLNTLLDFDKDQQLDPDIQLSGSGVKREKKDEENKIKKINKKNPNKFALMLEELSNIDSFPIFMENSSSEYSDFDNNIVQICNILAEVSPRVSQGKEIFALRTMIGYGFYTVTIPKVLTSRQIIGEIESIENGIKTMIPSITLNTPESDNKKRSIAYVGTGNLEIHEQILKEVSEFLDPMYMSTSIIGNEDDEVAKYFMLASLTPLELSKTIGLDYKDPSFQKFISRINMRNEKEIRSN